MRCPNGASRGALVLIAACGVLACSTLPDRTAGERAADAQIAAQVEAALVADPNIYARHIDVAVIRGVVRLGGFVYSDEDYRMARRDAAAISGVTGIHTEMELMRGGVSGSSR
jgi:osmotically-inducible protein OsmY